jgi:hypothetical protein
VQNNERVTADTRGVYVSAEQHSKASRRSSGSPSNFENSGSTPCNQHMRANSDYGLDNSA